MPSSSSIHGTTVIGGTAATARAGIDWDNCSWSFVISCDENRFTRAPAPHPLIHVAMSHTYQYPRAALTVDCVVFGLDESELKVLLIERGLEPFKGKWALPGGFVRVDETVDDAARRELAEEAGLKGVLL